jgi:catecholate siderophore receptor
MASSSRQNRRRSRAHSWTTVGAIVASATMASRGVSAEPSHPTPLSSVIVRQVEESIGRWDRPEDVLGKVHFLMREAKAEPSRQNPPVLRFDIPPGPLPVALRLFEQATGLTVRVVPEFVRDLTSPGARGLLTVDHALQQILTDSQLTHRLTGNGTVVVEVRPVSEEVQVTANALPAVTSPKFTAPLLDTPQTITVVPRSVIEAQGATTLRDVLRNVPGITMQAGEGGGGLPGDTLTMRGFSATNDIFVDGVRDVGPYSRDAFNLEQVEVIKGPSSAFGGRGSTGGAINLATKSAGLESIRQGTVGVGSSGYQRTTVDVNAPIEALGSGGALRVNAMWQDAGVAGRDVVNNRGWGMAPSFGVGLTGRTRFVLSSQHVRQDNVPDYGLPWGSSTDPATGEMFPTGAFEATPSVNQANFYGLEGYDFEDIRSDMGTARIDHDLRPGLTLRNVTRYGETFRNSAITAPRPPSRQLQRRQMENEAFINQTNLGAAVTTGALRHDLAMGIEAGREVTGTENSAQSTNQPQTTLRSPNPLDRPFDSMPALAGNPSRSVTRTVGAYLFDTVDLNQAWQVTAGLRWDRSEVEFTQTTRATGEVTELGRTDSMVSWRGGLVVKPRVNGTLYAGYGTSFNPAADAGNVGTALSALDTAANSVNLEPEKTKNFEVGTKWSLLDDRLALTGAVFHTEKTNARTRNLASEPFVLAGRQRVQGVELGASGRIAGTWMAFGSYALLDSEIVDSANPIEAGRDLALTPQATGSLWISGNVLPRLTIGGGVQYMDAIFRNTTTDLRVPSYWLTNATVAYELNAHLTLRVNATNLGDKAYVDRVGGGHYVPGPGRSVQVTTSVGF